MNLIKFFRANRSIIIWIVRISILLIMVFYFYNEFFNKPDFLLKFNKVVQFFLHKDQIKWVLFVILLTPVNLLLEAYKWKLLLSTITSISVFQALRGILAGLGIGLAFPAMLSDSIGRYSFTIKTLPVQASKAMLSNQLIQTWVSLLAGFIGLIVYCLSSIWAYSFIEFLFITILSIYLIIITLLLFKYPIINYIFNKFKYYNFDFEVIKPSILVLSLLRYCVFLIQYWLLFHSLIDNSVVLVLSGVALTLAFKTMVPVLNAFNDLGVRELSAIFFLGKLEILSEYIIGVSLLIWFINILAPSLIGLIFIVIFKLQLIYSSIKKKYFFN